MNYVKINNTLYPASVSGRMSDKDWEGRESKAITIDGDFATVDVLFHDGTAWSIVQETSSIVRDEDGNAVVDENGKMVLETYRTEFDNSEYSIRGDLIVHTDGTCTVKMGKPTDLEDAYEILYGGM